MFAVLLFNHVAFVGFIEMCLYRRVSHDSIDALRCIKREVSIDTVNVDHASIALLVQVT